MTRLAASDRVKLATRTEAPVTPEMIARFQNPDTLAELQAIFLNMVRLATDLDVLKKHLFYGKENNKAVGHLYTLRGTTAQIEAVLARFTNPKMIRVLHAVIGLGTEFGGEMLEQIEAHFFQGKPLDQTNVKEELGDGDWYGNLLCAVLGCTMQDIEEANIKKLVGGRYKDKFSQDEALLRDLGKERQILEESLEKEEKTPGAIPSETYPNPPNNGPEAREQRLLKSNVPVTLKKEDWKEMPEKVFPNIITLSEHTLRLHKEQTLDGKFHGRVFRNRDNKEEEVFVVFVPRDKHLLGVLGYYLGLCQQDGDPRPEHNEQVAAVYRLIRRVEHWQHNNKDLVKTPDAEPGECL